MARPKRQFTDEERIIFCCVSWSEDCQGRGFPTIAMFVKPFDNWHKRCKECNGSGVRSGVKRTTGHRFAELVG